MLYHDMRSASINMIDFESYEPVVFFKPHPSTKVIVHASLMALAWMFIVPLSILAQRFYGTAFPVSRLTGSDSTWFRFHRGGMILTACCCLAAFLLILAENNWTWCAANSAESFAHSIFGILTLSFFSFQVILSI